MTNIRDFPGSTARRDLHAVATWLAELANLTAGSIPLPDAKAKIASLASALVEEYPPAAFTRQSLLAIARDCKFFPSYGELCDGLSAWWRDNGPRRLALPEPAVYQHIPTPERRSPTTDELEEVGSIADRVIADIEAKFAATYDRPEQKPEPRHLTRTELNAAYVRDRISAPSVPQ